MAPPTPFVVNDVHATATWRNLLITFWRLSPTLRALDEVAEAARHLSARHPEGIGVFGRAPPGMRLLGSAERRRSGEMLREHQDAVRALASVIEGEGFWAGAARSAMAAITLMVRPPCPVRIFASVDAAAPWLAPRLAEPPIAASELMEALAYVRELG